MVGWGIGILLFFLLCASPTLALTVNFSIDPQNVNRDSEFEANIELIDAPKTSTYFLQIALTHPENPAYFGYTQNNKNEWHSYSEAYNTFFQIDTGEEGSWSGKIRGKPDLEDKDFKGAGDYTVKIGRFTSTGKTRYWHENNQILKIDFIPTPASTPQPSSTPIPAPTAKPTATSKPPTPTLRPTSSPPPTSPTPTTATITTPAPSPPTTTESQPSAQPQTPQVIPAKPWAAWGIVGLGLIFMASGALLYWHSVGSS